jgi:arginyl-tRNA synthetase
LTVCGAKVTKEYYFNDHGVQIDKFANSLYLRANNKPLPDDAYHGDYIAQVAQEVIDSVARRHRAGEGNVGESAGEAERSGATGEAECSGECGQPARAAGAGLLSESEQAQLECFADVGTKIMFANIKRELEEFAVYFDVFFHEQSLYDSGEVDNAIEKLKSLGVLYSKDGALWLESTKFGDDKDRVIIKSDGNSAYLAGDIAYYINKRNRGADEAIYILGADHHGYVGRMMAICAALGDSPKENMKILIGQMVNLIADGKPVKQSKRAGEVTSLRDFIDSVGVDAARFSLVRASIDSVLDIDLNLIAKHTNENPVYYVQYAHARCANVDRKAEIAGVSYDKNTDLSDLSTERDAELIATLVEFERVVKIAGEYLAPHRVAYYLGDLAAAYHKWYAECRVVPAEGEQVENIHRARLALNDATKQVLNNGLSLLGVSAPERM